MFESHHQLQESRESDFFVFTKLRRWRRIRNLPFGQCCIRSCSSHFPLLQESRESDFFVFTKLRPWRRIRNLPCGQCCISSCGRVTFPCSKTPNAIALGVLLFHFSLFTLHSRSCKASRSMVIRMQRVIRITKLRWGGLIVITEKFDQGIVAFKGD